MTRSSDEAITRLVQETHGHCVEYLCEIGIDPEVKLRQAARAVVWARHYSGDDGWERLKEAIGSLEDLVGLPTDKHDI
jgi:hypothetical protein